MSNDILTVYNQKINDLAKQHLHSTLENVLGSHHGVLLPLNHKRFMSRKSSSLFTYSEDTKKKVDVFKFIEELSKYSKEYFTKTEFDPNFDDLAKRYDTIISSIYKLISDGFIKSDSLSKDEHKQNEYLKTFINNISAPNRSEYLHYWVNQGIEQIRDFDRSLTSPILKDLINKTVLPLKTTQESRYYTTELHGTREERTYTTLASQLSEAHSKEDSDARYRKIVQSARKNKVTDIFYSILVDKKLLDVAKVMQQDKSYIAKSTFYKKFLRELNSQHYPNNLPLSYKFYDMIVNVDENYDVTDTLYSRLDEIIQGTPTALSKYGAYIEKEERKIFQDYKASKVISLLAHLEQVIGLNRTNSTTLTADPPHPKMIEEIETALDTDTYVDSRLQSSTATEQLDMREIFCYSLIAPLQAVKHLISFKNSEVFMEYFKTQVEELLKNDAPNQKAIINHLCKYNLIKEKRDQNDNITYVPHTSLFNVHSEDSEMNINFPESTSSEAIQIDPSSDSVENLSLPILTVLKNAFTQFTLADELSKDSTKASLDELEMNLGSNVYLRDLQREFNFNEVKSINKYYEQNIADSFKKYNAEEDEEELSNDITEKYNRYLQTLYALQTSLPLSDEVQAVLSHISQNSQHYHYQALLNNLQSYDQLTFVADQIHLSKANKKYYITIPQHRKIIKMLSENATPDDMTSIGYLTDHIEPSIKDNMYSSILSGRIFKNLSSSTKPLETIFDYLPKSNKELSKQLLIGHCKDEFFNYITKKVHTKTTLRRKHLQKMASFLAAHDYKLEENIIDSFYDNLSKVSSSKACNNISRVYFPLFDSTSTSKEQSKEYHDKHLGKIIEYYANSPVNSSFNNKFKALLTTQNAIQQYSTKKEQESYETFVQYMNSTVNSVVQTIFDRLYTAIITEQNAEAQRVLSLVDKEEYAHLFKEQFENISQVHQYAKNLSAQYVI